MLGELLTILLRILLSLSGWKIMFLVKEDLPRTPQR